MRDPSTQFEEDTSLVGFAAMANRTAILKSTFTSFLYLFTIFFYLNSLTTFEIVTYSFS